MTSKVDSPEPVGVVLDLDDLVAGVTADGGAAGDGVALVWDARSLDALDLVA